MYAFLLLLQFHFRFMKISFRNVPTYLTHVLEWYSSNALSILIFSSWLNQLDMVYGMLTIPSWIVHRRSLLDIASKRKSYSKKRGITNIFFKKSILRAYINILAFIYIPCIDSCTNGKSILNRTIQWPFIVAAVLL